MISDFKKLQKEASEAIDNSANAADLEKVRVKYLARKGELALVMKKIRDLKPSEKKEAGKTANEVKKDLLSKFFEKRVSFSKIPDSVRKEKEWIDVTAPGVVLSHGALHPITQILFDLEEFFRSMGYEVIEGPDIETDYYNFEALNMPKDHPSRDMQDTFYLENGMIPRTHTSGMQIRYMEKHKPPVRIIVPGRVYRNEKEDSMHTCTFYQLEGLVIDETTSFANLKATLMSAVKHIAGKDKQIRFRPSYFPYTEPSAEIDMTCFKCRGKGCTVCEGSGWIELGGSGMVHPALLARVGYDADKYQGFAFGFGFDRIMSMKHDIKDARFYYKSDLRFLNQF